MQTTRRVARLKLGTGEGMVPTVPSIMSDWPSRSTIREAQSRGVHRPQGIQADGDGLLRIYSKAWIPNEVDCLNLKLLTVAHAGQTGHLGAEATAASLSEYFIWQGIKTDTKDFVANCLLCFLSRGGSKIPRPLSLLHCMPQVRTKYCISTSYFSVKVKTRRSMRW